MKDNKKNRAEAAAKAEEKKARAAADPAPEGEKPEEAPEESNNITITREKLEELNAYVKAAEQKRDEYLAMAQRVQADFENFRKRNASLRTEIELPQNLAAPVKAGQQVGTVKVLCEEEEVDSCPILASGDVAARSFAGCFCRLAEALRPECENFVQNIGSEGR